MFLHGGYGRDNQSLFRYSILNEAWERLHGLRYRYSHTSVLVNDVIYVFGGRYRGKSGLPVEAYDPALDESFVVLDAKSLERLGLTHHIGAYLEPREEVFILGARQGLVSVFGLNARTHRVKQYRTKGSAPASLVNGDALTAFRDSLIVLSGAGLYMMTPHLGDSLTWSRIETARMEAFTRTVLHSMDRFVFCFGGIGKNMAPSDELIIVNVVNGDVTVVPHEGNDMITVEGHWPDATARHASCFSNGRMLVFGGAGLRSNVRELLLSLEWQA